MYVLSVSALVVQNCASTYVRSVSALIVQSYACTYFKFLLLLFRAMHVRTSSFCSYCSELCMYVLTVSALVVQNCACTYVRSVSALIVLPDA